MEKTEKQEKGIASRMSRYLIPIMVASLIGIGVIVFLIIQTI